MTEKEEKKAPVKQPQPEQKKVAAPAPEQEAKGKVLFSPAYASTVEEVIGRTGTRGEAIQVRCKILQGRDQDKIIRRNVKGPVRKGDILMLRETEIEAKPLTKKGRGNI